MCAFQFTTSGAASTCGCIRRRQSAIVSSCLDPSCTGTQSARRLARRRRPRANPAEPPKLLIGRRGWKLQPSSHQDNDDEDKMSLIFLMHHRGGTGGQGVLPRRHHRGEREHAYLETSATRRMGTDVWNWNDRHEALIERIICGDRKTRARAYQHDERARRTQCVPADVPAPRGCGRWRSGRCAGTPPPGRARAHAPHPCPSCGA